MCSNHDPGKAAERRQNAAAGGRLRSRRSPSEVERVRKRLWQITDAAVQGTLQRDRATVAIQALNGVLRSLTVERELALSDEIFEQMDELERDIRAVRGAP